jgi:hypothetical protein
MFLYNLLKISKDYIKSSEILRTFFSSFLLNESLLDNFEIVEVLSIKKR